ncbi:MAG: N-acetyltransferase [Patescibacteria group bacterium]
MESKNFVIREAKKKDFDILYALGEATPEFSISSNDVFMDPAEFMSVLEHEDSVFLVAESGEKIAGFIYASIGENKYLQKRSAYIVYIVTVPIFRKNGVAQLLYDACVVELKKRGIHNLYSWANNEGDRSIVAFFKKQGFTEGHNYLWMDKKL